MITSRSAEVRRTGDFVGRRHELAWLAERAEPGRTGAVWVRGVPGIGRTSLVRHLRDVRPDLRVLTVTADPAETGVEFGLVTQLLRRAGRTEHPGPGEDPSHAGRLLAGLTGDRPTALVVDDVEWADPSSMRALEHLVRDRTGPAVVLVGGPAGADAHPARRRPARAGDDRNVLELGGLTPDDVVQMATHVLGRAATATTTRQLLDRTGGHPGHLRSLMFDLRTTVCSGMLPVPRSLVRSACAACGALPAGTRAMLDALSVLDGPQPPGTLARLAACVEPGIEAGTDPVALLAPAVKAGLVNGELPSAAVGFADRRHRDALYAALSPARRCALHRAAVEMVDAPTRWPHRVAAATAADDGLADELHRAALADADRGQHDLAARNLAWAADLSARADRYRQLAAVHAAFDAGVSTVRPDIRSTARTSLRSLALGLTALLHDGDHRAAEWWLLAALDVDQQHGGDAWVRTVAAAGLAGLRLGDDRDSEAHGAVELALADGGLPQWLAECLRMLASLVAMRRAGLRGGLDELHHLPADPADASLPQLDTLTQRGALRLLSGDVEGAAADLDAVLARHPEGRLLLAGTGPWSCRSVIHFIEGRWDDAEESVARALAGDRPRDLPHARVLSHVCAVQISAARGHRNVAEKHAVQARRIAAESGGRHERYGAAVAEALLCAVSDDQAGVLGALEPVLDAGRQHTAEWWGLWWRPLAVDALVVAGRLDEAAAHLEVLRETTSGSRHLEPTLVRLTAVHADAAGDPAGAVRLVREFLDRRTAVLAPLAHAMLEHDHGRRLHGMQRRTESAVRLRSAQRRFAELGAEPFRRRAARDAGRENHLPVRRVRHGVVLTEREAQVAGLVEQGLTNREAARRLSIAPKTVEYHLGNVFAKLAISSRDELLDDPVTGAPGRLRRPKDLISVPEQPARP